MGAILSPPWQLLRIGEPKTNLDFVQAMALSIA